MRVRLLRSICSAQVLIPLAGIALAGCSDKPEITSSTRSAQHEVYSGPDRAQESFFRHLAERVPAFGGFFFDLDGNLIVQVAGLSARAQADLTPMLNSFLNQRLWDHRSAGAGAIVFRDAEYSFSQLDQFRSAIEPVWEYPGIVYTDIDEVANRLVIAIEEIQYRHGIESRLEDLNVESNAVEFRLVTPIVPAIAHAALSNGAPGNVRSSTDALDAHHRPVEGGRQISMLTANYGDIVRSNCTAGFPAMWNSHWVLVVNSHCSHTMWREDPDSAKYYAHQYGESIYSGGIWIEQIIGDEIHDPPGWACWIGITRGECRNSDAALVKLTGPTGDAQTRIARPIENVGPGRGLSGSLVVDDVPNSYMYITDKRQVAYAGEPVHKVGRTTGWTWGYVQETCIDGAWGGKKLICQQGATYSDSAGDSGSPVFINYSDSVVIQGLHWGHNATRALYSPIERIEMDLGTLMLGSTPQL